MTDHFSICTVENSETKTMPNNNACFSLFFVMIERDFRLSL